jgi:outer membrane protein TolC
MLASVGPRPSAVSFDQLYDEALETDAQLQSAPASLTADSEQLPQAPENLLPQLSASVTVTERRSHCSACRIRAQTLVKQTR